MSTMTLHKCPHLDWDERKQEILRDHSCDRAISVAAAFLSDDDEGGRSRPRLKPGQAPLLVDLTVADFEARMVKLQVKLTRAWTADQKVAALKIAIECSKLLIESRAPQYYPSMFVLVSEILDTFGRLVFERLRAGAEEENVKMGVTGRLQGRLHDDFTVADVGADTQETCRNWFYKISCIRELLPRLYIEIALLPCYRFVVDADFPSIMIRLAHGIRGIGDPIVAIYARLYLARMVAVLVRDDDRQRAPVLACIHDYLLSFREQTSPARLAQLQASHALDQAAYLRLHRPALAWLMHQAGWGAPPEVYAAVEKEYEEHSGDEMVLGTMKDGFGCSSGGGRRKDDPE